MNRLQSFGPTICFGLKYMYGLSVSSCDEGDLSSEEQATNPFFILTFCLYLSFLNFLYIRMINNTTKLTKLFK